MCDLLWWEWKSGLVKVCTANERKAIKRRGGKEKED